MKPKATEGVFEVIDSFVIRKRNEFYLIGTLKEGNAKENWFVNIPLNSQFYLTLRIKQIDDVEITSEPGKKYTLIVVHGDNEALDLFLSLNIGSELLNISVEGED